MDREKTQWNKTRDKATVVPINAASLTGTLPQSAVRKSNLKLKQTVFQRLDDISTKAKKYLCNETAISKRAPRFACKQAPNKIFFFLIKLKYLTENNREIYMFFFSAYSSLLFLVRFDIYTDRMW